MNTITIESLEALATELEQTAELQTTKLKRLIAAYARILWQREPEHFKRRDTEHGDEAGHWDSSYPPKQVYRARTGPRLVLVDELTTDDVPTSGGFYYSWRRVTTDGGVYVDRMGQIYECEETGTGRLGQFAAHPGDCDVECTLDWSRNSKPTLDQLALAEQKMRELAFPLSQAVAS